ncbi:MAG: GNAT family N-acetyltransferase [Bacilli bacterium]|nr:GNAT family N-acetyltransferase [Bacilli bacterium]
MNNLTIEKLRKEDLKEAVSIYDINHNLTTNCAKLFKEYDKIYNNPDYHNIVAKIDNKIVGLATIVVNHDIVEELKPFLTIWNFGVHKDYRRNKIGTRMLNYIYEYAEKLECEFIALIAEKDNVIGQKFYESLGYYKQVGFVKLINKEKW